MEVNKPNDWLEAVKQEIVEKYKTKNPRYVLNETQVEEIEISKWLDESIGEPDEWLEWLIYPEKREAIEDKFPYGLDPSENVWLHYKFLENNTFEMKPFYPSPSLKICQKILDEFMNRFWTETKLEKSKVMFTIMGDCIYDEKEIRKELLYLIRIGLPKIDYLKKTEERDGFIVYSLITTPDTLPNMLKSGYLQLEYFD